jgi:hypothetical protein
VIDTNGKKDLGSNVLHWVLENSCGGLKSLQRKTTCFDYYTIATTGTMIERIVTSFRIPKCIGATGQGKN